MENIQEIREKLVDILRRKFNAMPACGGKEWVIHCRYCVDNSVSHGHMYISLPTSDTPSFFNCFKCGSSGIVNNKKLNEWGINDVDLLIGVSKMNKHVLSLEKNRKLRDRDVYILNNNYISENPLSEAKLRYINKRIGTTLGYQDLLDNKIVLNLYDLIESNQIQKLTRYPDICDELNESFLGFISIDNAFVNLRNLRKGKLKFESIDKRWVNYSLFDKVDNTETYYVPPTSIDISRPEKIDLRIAEGALDILSVKYNIVQSTFNNIYASILGSSYYAIVRYFIVTLGITNFNLHIYPDSDINPNYFDDLYEILKPYDISLKLHFNVKKGNDIFGKPIKDFGVDISRIEERIYDYGTGGSYNEYY